MKYLAKRVDRLVLLMSQGQTPWKALAWLVLETNLLVSAGLLVSMVLPDELWIASVGVVGMAYFWASDRYYRKLDEVLGMGEA